MQTFFCKLIPPRPSFPLDMSEAEVEVMRDHGGYWRTKMTQGQVVAFGPVFDPAGAYGLGIIEVTDEAAGRDFMENDPAVRSAVGFRYEMFPMPQGVVHRESQASVS